MKLSLSVCASLFVAVVVASPFPQGERREGQPFSYAPQSRPEQGQFEPQTQVNQPPFNFAGGQGQPQYDLQAPPASYQPYGEGEHAEVFEDDEEYGGNEYDPQESEEGERRDGSGKFEIIEETPHKPSKETPSRKDGKTEQVVADDSRRSKQSSKGTEVIVDAPPKGIPSTWVKQHLAPKEKAKSSESSEESPKKSKSSHRHHHKKERKSKKSKSSKPKTKEPHTKVVSLREATKKGSDFINDIKQVPVVTKEGFLQDNNRHVRHVEFIKPSSSSSSSSRKALKAKSSKKSSSRRQDKAVEEDKEGGKESSYPTSETTPKTSTTGSSQTSKGLSTCSQSRHKHRRHRRDRKESSTTSSSSSSSRSSSTSSWSSSETTSSSSSSSSDSY